MSFPVTLPGGPPARSLAVSGNTAPHTQLGVRASREEACPQGGPNCPALREHCLLSPPQPHYGKGITTSILQEPEARVLSSLVFSAAKWAI